VTGSAITDEHAANAIASMRVPRGLGAKLLAAVRPEFRAGVRYAYPDDRVLGGLACRVGQCGRVARRRGMCSGHGLRWARQGRPDLGIFVTTTDATLNGQRPYEACLVAGCGYGQHSRRLCERHHWWWKKSQAPDVATWLSAGAPAVDEPQPLCHVPSCVRWAEPRGRLCVKHAVRWRCQGRPDIEVFSQSCQTHQSVCERVDFMVLAPHLRLEMQYVFQQRHDDPAGRALMRTSVLQHVFDLLADSGMPSVLAWPEDDWRAFLTAPATTKWRMTSAYLSYARDQIEALQHGLGWDVEYHRQAWRLRNLGIDDPSVSTISFAAIAQPWLNALVKRWTRWRLSSGLNPNTALKGVAGMTHFAQFLAGHSIDALSKIDRAVLEQYLAHLHAGPHGHWQRQHFISAIGTFMADTRRHGWDDTLPVDAVFYREDSPKLPKPVPRALAEHVMSQVEKPEHLRLFNNPTYELITLILMRCGLRITDTVRLPFDCVVTDAEAAPYLRYHNHKMNREALVPIDDELQQFIIGHQRQLLQRWPQGLPVLFPRPTTNRNGRKPISAATYRSALRPWLLRCDVRDELGQPVRLTPHQWRHTLGTRLINRDVPQEVVRRILDHESAEMTARYARLHDTTVRRHWENARKVNISGDTVTLDPDGPLAAAAWAKQRLSRATQALPNGYCGLPLAKSCPHANACLACPMFLTTAEFLPQHRKQRTETLQIISRAEAAGHSRLAEMNRQVADNLEKIITALEVDEPGQVAHAS
jgi:site-specific recombinase XerD